MKLEKVLQIKINEDILTSYREYCKKNGFDMSKRIRLYIESEISKDKLNIK